MTDPTPAELWTIWQDASRTDAIDHAIAALYTELDQAVRDAPTDGPHGTPSCSASGRCCKFDTYGHRLYVTGLEIAWFLERVSGAGAGGLDEAHNASGGSSSLALPLIEPGDVSPPKTGETRAPKPETRAALPDACRYQVDGLCTAHTIRPLGCRVYFCTPGTDDWQHAVYERFQHRLQQIHAEHALPYRYMEWRSGLVEADRWLAGAKGPPA